ncbi:MAG TPA: thioredoxin domain-containing protein [Pyrinomonadaceae bacterium]|jgi:protein-disulfide isomerase|nr:thioredoxin domain-containing protein [Pyrinomonadaceae bacterium]
MSVFLCFLVLAGIARGQTPETVVASVNGVPITQKQVDDSIATRIYPLQQQLYAIRKAALDNLVVSRLLEAEALARGVSVEDLRRQLTQGAVNVTRAQVEEAFAQNASFFASMSPDEARERLRLDLENQARMKYYRAALDGLRKKWTITVSLAAPAFALDEGESPVRGVAAKPAVTIVEFSDFECRFCRDVQPALKQVLESHAKDVRLVFKHLPLEGHRNAVPAARAAYCAGEQDRFWQFHDALFAKESLSPGVFDRIASEIGLGLPRFKECLSSEHSRAAVIKDIETARSFRIESTPSFLVNGKLFTGALNSAEWQKIIERELNQTSSRK